METQVATAETEAETARAAAEALRKTGRQSCEHEGPGASQGRMAAGAMTCGLGGTTAGGVAGGVKAMTTPGPILVGDMSAFSLRFRAVAVE